MKTIQALLAGLLLAGLCWPISASAQDVPPGTYLRSCGEVYLRGDTLVATCRGMDGSAHRSSLPRVRGCVGDIGNINGRLNCNYADAPQQQPYYGAAPQQQPYYGGAPQQQPYYGAPQQQPYYGAPGYAPPYGR
jgi:hypothetical protein